MNQDEEMLSLKEENTLLHKKIVLLQENISLQQGVMDAQQEQIRLQQQEIDLLRDQLRTLQERVAKDSHNSHLPPSSDRFARQPKSLRTTSGKKPGGQHGHVGKHLMRTQTPDVVVVHAVERCEQCQHAQDGVLAHVAERRQVIDLPVQRTQVIEHQAEQKRCPWCQYLTRASFPDLICAPIQYSTTIAALGVYLVQQQLLPYARSCEVLFDWLGITVSPGTLAQWIAQCAVQVEPVEEQIKVALQHSAVMHQDETGLYVNGKRMWMHVCSTPTLTHYAVHPKRGHTAMDAIGIAPLFTGVSVHDGWASYAHYCCEHALCNVHLLRELTFLEEQVGQGWARQMKAVLVDMKASVERAQQQGQTQVDAKLLAHLKEQYTRIVEEGLQSNPRAVPPLTPTRGRPKRGAARCLLDGLNALHEQVLAFLDNFAVPFDNNLAERDIRMVKVQQKVSGCFRSEQGAQAFCRLRGYLSTMRKQGHRVLTALELALKGHPVSPAF